MTGKLHYTQDDVSISNTGGHNLAKIPSTGFRRKRNGLPAYRYRHGSCRLPKIRYDLGCLYHQFVEKWWPTNGHKSQIVGRSTRDRSWSPCQRIVWQLFCTFWYYDMNQGTLPDLHGTPYKSSNEHCKADLGEHLLINSIDL